MQMNDRNEKKTMNNNTYRLTFIKLNYYQIKAYNLIQYLFTSKSKYVQLQPQQHIIPHRVTPVMFLQDEPPTDLVNDEFPLQLEATQQITRELDEARDI